MLFVSSRDGGRRSISAHNRGLLFGGSQPRRLSMERARGSAGKDQVVIPHVFEPIEQGRTLGILDSGACRALPERAPDHPFERAGLTVSRGGDPAGSAAQFAKMASQQQLLIFSVAFDEEASQLAPMPAVTKGGRACAYPVIEVSFAALLLRAFLRASCASACAGSMG